jgi:hypothetical protein
MNVSRRHHLNQYFSEILRRNHNFVAAAKSLVDHSRVLYKKLYENSDRFLDYQTEVEKRFVKDPLTQFVIVFRHFCQHYRSPDVSAKMSYTTGEPLSKKILLRKNDLMEFDGWNTSAKEFIKNADNEIDLQILVSDYHSHVTDFYKWFYSRLEKIHEPEQKAIEEKQKELRTRMLPQMLMMMRSSIELYKQNGIGNVLDVLTGFLSPEDLAALEIIEGTPAKWMETAISRIESRFSLPEDIKDELIKLAKMK